MREWLNNHRALTGGVAIIIVAAAVALPTLLQRRSEPVAQQYFYDLETKQLFASNADHLPPIASRAGKPDGAVRAYVYACASCADENDRFVAYLEKLTEEAKRAQSEETQFHKRRGDEMDIPPVVMQEMLAKTESGTLVASPDQPDQWFASNTPQAGPILSAADTRCKSAAPILCTP